MNKEAAWDRIDELEAENEALTDERDALSARLAKAEELLHDAPPSLGTNHEVDQLNWLDERAAYFASVKP